MNSLKNYFGYRSLETPRTPYEVASHQCDNLIQYWREGALLTFRRELEKLNLHELSKLRLRVQKLCTELDVFKICLNSRHVRPPPKSSDSRRIFGKILIDPCADSPHLSPVTMLWTATLVAWTVHFVPLELKGNPGSPAEFFTDHPTLSRTLFVALTVSSLLVAWMELKTVRFEKKIDLYHANCQSLLMLADSALRAQKLSLPKINSPIEKSCESPIVQSDDPGYLSTSQI